MDDANLGIFFDVNFFMCSRKFVLITSDGSLCVLDPGVEWQSCCVIYINLILPPLLSLAMCWDFGEDCKTSANSVLTLPDLSS